MSLTLIYLLLFLVIAAAFLYLYYVRHRPQDDIGGLSTASLVFLVGVLIPFTAWVLYEQATAKDRLAALGLAVYPGLGSSVGVATGGLLSQDSWVFRLDDPNIDAFMRFYANPSNTGQWQPASDTAGIVVLVLDERRLLISGHQNTGMFVLNRSVSE